GMVYSADGLPQAQVSLVFRSVSDSRWAQSGEDGSYRVAVLAGTYWVEVWADNSRLIPHQVLGPLEVAQDTAWDLKLSAGGLLSGSVVDDRGNRVTGALVNVWRISDDVTRVDGDSVKTADGTVRLAEDSLLIMPFVPGSSAVAPPFYVSNYYNFYTNETGAWKAALMPGQYAVEVVPPWEYPQKSYKVDVYAVTEGAMIELGEVKIEYGVLFSGRVVLADGKPLAWQSVSLLSPVDSGEKPDNGISYPVWVEPYYRADFYTDENGAFSRRVFPGIYDLLFYGGTGDLSYPRQTINNFDLSRDLSLTITLEAGNRLYGTVADEQGRGLEGSYLSFFLDDGTWVGGVPNGPDGAYQIQLMPGVYNLVVSPTMGYFPDSAGLSLKLDGDRKLDVTLRPGVKIYGRVTDASGQPLAQVSVQLVASFQKADTVFKNLVLESFRAANSLLPEGADQPDSTVADSVKPVYTDQAGRYALQPWFDNRAFYAWTDDAGNWEVLVKKGVYDIYAAYYYTGYAGAFLPAVDCSQERRVDLVLEDAQITVEGVVKDESGQPVPMTLVSLLDPKTGGNVYGWTDQAGRFALNVPQGQYEIFVDGGDDSDQSRSVASNLTVDRNQNLDIQLGTGILNGDSEPDGPKLPRAFALAQNYPNPFNPSTTISYTIADPAQVALTIFDLRGRKVATLVDRQQEEGDYTVQWDGKDSEGRTLSSGIYFYRLKSGAEVATRKMVLLK
ncbi:MAG: carboxypeptidase regulatory-like domain-containing protein, partial [Candidatus Glassbacteria bacterium]